MKRTLQAMLLALVAIMMPIGAWAAAATDITVTIDTGDEVTLKDADGDGSYDIGTADELYAFAAAVNGGNTAINGELTANIVVNEGTMTANTTGARVWTPIGNSSNKYTGTFDGAGFSVSGLYFKDSTVNYVGLFGYVGNGATVQNITIADSYLSGQTYVGSVVGLNYGTVSNCINSSEIVGSKYNTGGVVGQNNGTVSGSTNSGAVSGNRYVGGVVGQNIGTVSGCSNSGDVTGSDSNTGGIVGINHGTITDCTNRGTVSGINNVGGIAGENGGTVSGCTNSGGVSGNAYVGGIVGDNGFGTVTNCHNTATVNATYSDCKVGGVAGYNYEGVVSNCYNTGTVNGSDGCYVGGVVGYNCNAAEGSTVTNCYNTGAVTGADDVGGVVGHNSEGTVSNCYNTGTVTSAGDLGGVSGSQVGTYTNCYYLDTTASGGIFGADVEGQAEARTAEQFASGEVAALLQGEQAEQVWGQAIDTDDYPVLGGAAVYYGYLSCADDAVKVYTNTAGASDAKPGHSPVDGICTVCGHIDAASDVTLRDGVLPSFTLAEDTEVASITYTRTLPNTEWNALYVPFEIPVSELADNYDVAYINDVHSYDNDDNGEIDDLQMEIIKITSGTLHANHPYLIRAKSEDAQAMSLTLTDATLCKTEVVTLSCTSMYMKFDVTGTYDPMPQADNEDILVITSDGAWKMMSEGSSLNPFRLYLTLTALDGSPVKVTETAMAKVRIVTRGESTGIDNSQLTIDNAASGAVYDLQGRRVTHPTKGIYIVNGKKVIF